MRGMAKLIVLTMLLINPIRHGGAVSGGEAEVVMVQGESENEEMMMFDEEEMEEMEERGRLSVRIDSSLPRHLCHRIHKNLKVRSC